jgi:predicted amidohydrolase YtcJ
MKKRYTFTDGETIDADLDDLRKLLAENQCYLDNYEDVYSSLEDDDYVARGNGFCDRKYSDDFIEGQMEKYGRRVKEIEGWIAEWPAEKPSNYRAKIIFTAFFLTFITIMSSCNQKTSVDLILHNANIYTVDNDFTKVQAFAVKDGKFVAVGDEKQIMQHYTAKEIIDAQGNAVYPGFMDGHCHFTGYGENLVRWANLKGCRSFDEVIERLKVHDSLYPSDWLLGRGWDQNLWEVAEFPDNKKLVEVFPDKKVLLTRVDGHAVLVSKEVLELAGIDENTKMDGGMAIVKDGRCTGVLLDNLADAAKALVPKMETELRVQALLKAQENCMAVGLTSVTDAGLDIATIELIDSLQQAGQLIMHVNAMVNPDDETMDYFMGQGVIDKECLTVRSVKIYADGALGSRGAKLLEPYSDDPTNTGLMVENDDFYHHVCQKAYDAGFQVCCHAIGDGGVRHVLDIYSEYLKGQNDLRWRIEHSQVVDEADFQRYGEYSVIPSIQTTHCTSDMDWADERLGEERIKNAYAYQRLLQQNGWVVNGTDFPIEDIGPIYTFYAAVARKHLDGSPAKGFQMENALTREQALRSITIWVAKGCFLENRKGSIEVGKDADFVILDRDLMTIAEDEIPAAIVKMCYIPLKME